MFLPDSQFRAGATRSRMETPVYTASPTMEDGDGRSPRTLAGTWPKGEKKEEKDGKEDTTEGSSDEIHTANVKNISGAESVDSRPPSETTSIGKNRTGGEVSEGWGVRRPNVRDQQRRHFPPRR